MGCVEELKFYLHYKSPENRNQIMLFPQLDLWIENNNPVRLIDSIVDKIIENNPERFTWKGQSNKGCTCYSPRYYEQAYTLLLF